MAESDNTRVRLRTDEISWREVGDEAVVLESATGIYLTLNASGMLLWKALVAGATPTEMTAMLVERYGIDGDEAAADVASYLDWLRARRLVEADRS